MTTKITKCRYCNNENLKVIVDLGEQHLSGIFPNEPELEHKSPLRLVKCSGPHSREVSTPCGLIQMEHTFDPDVMYGDDYGYRSGLNNSMVKHLKGRVDEIISRFEKNKKADNLQAGDLVVDIAGNDGTTLGFYPEDFIRVNIDPTANKFKDYQPEGTIVIPEYYSAKAVNRVINYDEMAEFKRAKVVTAFSMLYDIPDLFQFVNDVKGVLDEDGLVVFEQSYMPAMFKALSYDTICHEHLSYFSLTFLHKLFDECGFKIVDVTFNDCNGGSFVTTIAQKTSEAWDENTKVIEKILKQEVRGKYDKDSTWEKWVESIDQSKDDLKELIAGKKVAALGASTKGNVLLQYCGLGPDDIEVIGDVNPDKNGCYTPGTWIPITDEDTVLAGDYDYYLVLPWHFKEFFINNPKFKGKTLLFPLPEVHTVTVE